MIPSFSPVYYKNGSHAPGIWGVCRLDRWLVLASDAYHNFGLRTTTGKGVDPPGIYVMYPEKR
jgi:hypothetical protein